MPGQVADAQPCIGREETRQRAHQAALCIYCCHCARVRGLFPITEGFKFRTAKGHHAVQVNFKHMARPAIGFGLHIGAASFDDFIDNRFALPRSAETFEVQQKVRAGGQTERSKPYLSSHHPPIWHGCLGLQAVLAHDLATFSFQDQPSK